MRINAITNWAYGVTVLLTGLSGAAFILSTDSAIKERQAVEQHLVLDTLGEELALGAEMRSDEARLFVMRGDERHLEAFHRAEEEERRREEATKTAPNFGASPGEIAALQEIVREAEALDRIEVAAIEAYQKGDRAGAQEKLFGAEHERLQTALLDTVARFRDLTNARTGTALNEAQERSDWYAAAAKTMLGITAALFLSVLYFILKRRVAMPLSRMSGIVTRLAEQDYAVEVPLDRRRDEIGEMNQAIHIFRENGIERDRLDAERRRDQQTKDLILQMMHRLQACQSQNELAEVVARFAPQIFPNLAGHLYVLNDSRTLLTRVGTWLDPKHSAPTFPSSACWGLRRGRPHVSNRGQSDIACQHLDDHGAVGLCVPLTAQGDTIGLLYFEEHSQEEFTVEASRLYLELIAENIGLAVANLQLREKLTNLAVRDALTGLLNRRCLDEALNRQPRGKALTCLMVDIDHFKRFNDEFGHDAGDVVMQYVAQIILDAVADAGNAYRFGGEEFTVLMPEAGEAAGHELAERLRTRIGTTPLSHRGRILGTVSVSVGIASAPDDGPVSTLLTRADAALIDAKNQGRNRSVSASGLSFDGGEVRRSLG
ncbi:MULTISPECIES: diguanylate cyclase [unclassified Ensifer]|uniref:diguanylate cyclase n=1 Tax=unclassified Ensifer TaxID=2633371 RepID=UPI0008132BB0|nr:MULTISPECIES: diguanylate cyclase [unclassified Ensifer]OCO98387.1 diguanylate cyclase [Ensifer sp. LC13]OCP05288.1 diguanylate cyclase [Ensifer sp. LC14]OCP14624.1 diguanylate cyclase [Ensifer sp. LC11]OCP29280.1 diguanylate cyclase [Ensifer sp. LC499]